MKLVHDGVEKEAHSIVKDDKGFKGFDADNNLVFILRTQEECIVYDSNDDIVEFITDKERIAELEQIVNLLLLGGV